MPSVLTARPRQCPLRNYADVWGVSTSDLRHFRHNLGKTITNGSLKGFVIEFVYRDEAGHLVPPRQRVPLDRLLVQFQRRPNVPLIDPALIRQRETEVSAMA